MKKILAIFLAALLFLCGVSAEEGLSEGMSRVTSIVKETLALSDDYDEFSGNFSDGRWWLYWESQDCSATVSCDENGTVYHFYNYENKVYNDTYSLGFPKNDPEAIAEKCGEFLDRVITRSDWGWELDEIRSSLVFRGDALYAGGRLTYRGYPTDIRFDLALDAETGEVISYSRGDCWSVYSEKEGEDEVNITREQALEALKESYAFKTVYRVVDPMEMAKPVYARIDPSEKAVRAADGKLIDAESMIAVDEEAEYSVKATADAGAAYGRALTEAELKGVSVYDGALKAEELDGLMRKNPYLKLTDDYRFGGADYYAGKEGLRAELSYSMTTGDGIDVYRNIGVNALTGAIESMSAYSDAYSSEDGKADPEQWKETVEAFARDCFGAEYAQMIYGRGESSYWYVSAPAVRYVFYRVYDGLNFEENCLNVTVDSADGSVIGCSLTWNNGQEFYEADPESFIGEEEALRIWWEASDLTLNYLSVYSEEDKCFDLTLCWVFTGCEGVTSADAVSGELYGLNRREAGTYEYDGEDGMLYADEIRRLGQFGIGIAGCGFTAEDACSAQILMNLLLQSRGAVESGKELEGKELNDLFRSWFGTVPETDEDGLVNRGELARIMTAVTGYEKAAALEGIFTYAAADFDAVPASLQGSVAIALKLGYLTLTEDGLIARDMPALAAEAAHAVYVTLS